ncbi:MAG: hypothetical protein NTW08_02595 [Gammaproteobacteria bacterium]|nr:hypothetical protein [Gammaproteobacteria bacterium]
MPTCGYELTVAVPTCDYELTVRHPERCEGSLDFGTMLSDWRSLAAVGMTSVREKWEESSARRSKVVSKVVGSKFDADLYSIFWPEVI